MHPMILPRICFVWYAVYFIVLYALVFCGMACLFVLFFACDRTLGLHEVHWFSAGSDSDGKLWFCVGRVWLKENLARAKAWKHVDAKLLAFPA